MNTISRRAQQIAASIEGKGHADAFVEAEITTTLPFQIRAMRKERGWTQAEVARRTRQHQKTISEFENPNYARFTLKTLKRLASAFDVALIVRFAPFSELVDWTATLSPERLNVPGRSKDDRLQEQRQGGRDEVDDATGTAAVLGGRCPVILTDASERSGTESTGHIFLVGNQPHQVRTETGRAA